MQHTSEKTTWNSIYGIWRITRYTTAGDYRVEVTWYSWTKTHHQSCTNAGIIKNDDSRTMEKINCVWALLKIKFFENEFYCYCSIVAAVMKFHYLLSNEIVTDNWSTFQNALNIMLLLVYYYVLCYNINILKSDVPY